MALTIAGLVAWAQAQIAIPVPIRDPLGLADGVSVTLAPLEAHSVEDWPRDTRTTAVGSFPSETNLVAVPILRPEDYPLGIPPSRLEIDVLIGASLSLRSRGSSTPVAYPDEVVVTRARILHLRIDDSGDTEPITLETFDLADGTTLTWRKTERCRPQRCTYQLDGDPQRASIRIVAAGDQLASALDILGNDAAPNRLTGRLALALDTPLPDGATIEVTLRAPSGTAFF